MAEDQLRLKIFESCRQGCAHGQRRNALKGGPPVSTQCRTKVTRPQALSTCRRGRLSCPDLSDANAPTSTEILSQLFGRFFDHAVL